MKKLATLAIALYAITVPALSFAQSQAPLTRAQVVAELAQLEQAGYNPSTGDNANYPADIEAAEAKLAATQAQAQARAQAPATAQRPAGKGMQMSSADCVGPASFCNTYFGS